MNYVFDNFQLDSDRFTLSRDEEVLKIEPLVFDLLAYLLERSNSVVSKDELLEHVWKGRVVSDTTIASAIKSARKAIGDSGSTQRALSSLRSP